MKIGFSQTVISPPKGIILAGYASKEPRKNIGVHDDLHCKAIVFDDDSKLYTIMILDIMCVDESLANRIADKLLNLGFDKENVIAAAIHTHSAPAGVFTGEGELAPLNNVSNNSVDEDKQKWLDTLVDKCVEAVIYAKNELDTFVYKYAHADLPNVGSDRNNGNVPNGRLHVLEFKTSSGKKLLVYNFPCHPTVMNATNLMVSADFIGHIPMNFKHDMCIFFQGPAGDVSTRFIREESSFDECERLGKVAADAINEAIAGTEWKEQKSFSWYKKLIELKLRDILDEETCKKEVEQRQKELQDAIDAGITGKELRVIKSFEEGAVANLGYSNKLRNSGLTSLHLPLTFIKFDDLNIVSVPGELFSKLIKREDIIYICYANAYYRYIPDMSAFEKRYYEALGSLIKPGQGEVLINHIEGEI